MGSRYDDPSAPEYAPGGRLRAPMARPRVPALTAGESVHVRTDGTCRAAIVLASCRGSRAILRVLAIAPAVSIDLAAFDSQGSYPHHSERLTFPNPDGTSRVADSWHVQGDPSTLCDDHE